MVKLHATSSSRHHGQRWRASARPGPQVVYLTEDAGAGKFRLFRPNGWGDLPSGVLEAAVVSGSTVTWTNIDLQRRGLQRRRGAWYANGKVWFSPAVGVAVFCGS